MSCFISFLDYMDNCSLQKCSKLYKRLGRSPYLWRQLFETERGLRGVFEDSGPRDWLGEFKRLRPCWDDAVLGSSGRLEVLLDEREAPPNGGGLDPKVFFLGAGKVLALAGATYSEPFGGWDLRQGFGAYLMDVASEAGIAWRGIEVSGRPHPVLHGSYCGAYGDGVVADKVVCFAGGSRTTLNDTTSLLEIGGVAENVQTALHSLSVSWSTLATEPAPCLTKPSARFGGLGCVWGMHLLVFAGRTATSFFDELWFLDLQNLEWRQPVVSGEGPTPRVGVRGARCGDRLLVYGGAKWEFDPRCWGNDVPGTLWALFVENLRPHWERITVGSGALRPPLRVAPAVAICGRHLLVYGGVDLPSQEYFDDAWLFDLVSHEWSQMKLAHMKLAHGREAGRYWCRSNLAAVFIRERRSCIMFGGGRYFEGVYFQEVAELVAQV